MRVQDGGVEIFAAKCRQGRSMTCSPGAIAVLLGIKDGEIRREAV